MAIVNVENLHIAVMKSEGVYETPVKISPTVNISISPNVNRSTIYGDGRPVAALENMGEIEVEVNITDLTPEAYLLLFGKTKNDEGVVVDSSKDRAPYVALGFKSEKHNNKFRYVWLYKGKFSLPEDVAQTKTDSIEAQTYTIVGSFIAREDGKWRVWVDEDDPDVDPKVIENWFQQVYEEGQSYPED